MYFWYLPFRKETILEATGKLSTCKDQVEPTSEAITNRRIEWPRVEREKDGRLVLGFWGESHQSKGPKCLSQCRLNLINKCPMDSQVREDS